MPCPDCSAVAAELDAARKRQADLEQTVERVRNDLDKNAKAQADVDKRRGDIDADIERQRDTFVSTDSSGATLRSQYDLATGERVTTRTPPGGPTTEVNREPSAWLKKLLDEKAQLDTDDAQLNARQKALEAERTKAQSDLATAKQRVDELQKLLDDCLKKHCGATTQAAGATGQSIALVVDRAQVMEFKVPSGQDAHTVTDGLAGAWLFPIPSGAGGGFQVGVPVPTDPAAAAALKAKLDALAAQGTITDLQVTPCRKYLPDGATTSGSGGATAPRSGRTALIIKGTAKTGTGVELGQAVVILVPPPVVDQPAKPGATGEQKPGDSIDAPLPWIIGVDDRGPAISTPDPNGDFVIVVPDGYRGPYTLILAPICNCTTTTQTRTPTPQTVPVGSATATSAPPPSKPISSAPPTAPRKPEPCLCGPDITQAMLAAINRAQQRIAQLPSNEVGPFDGFQFLYNNADAFDAPVAPLKDPTKDPATLAHPEDGWLCPSGICAQMDQPPFTFAGYCLPKHMSNEILAAFVASGVGVPITGFSFGANVRELTNYGSLEGDAPFVAYLLGYALQGAAADGPLSQQQVEDLAKDILEPTLFGLVDNYGKVKAEYPELAKCELCPYDVAGHFSKDFTTKPWKLSDGRSVGGDAGTPTGDDAGPAPEPEALPASTLPPLKPGAKPPQDCGGAAAGAGSTTTGTGCGAPVGSTTGGAAAPSQNGTATQARPVAAATDPRDADWKENGPPLPETEDASQDGDLVRPGEARFERTLRQSVTGIHSREIYTGIDRSTRGIMEASSGNEAARAMGLPPSSDRPGAGGYEAASNSNYPTHTGQ